MKTELTLTRSMGHVSEKVPNHDVHYGVAPLQLHSGAKSVSIFLELFMGANLMHEHGRDALYLCHSLIQCVFSPFTPLIS